MRNYQIQFLSGKVIRCDYIEALKIDDALTKFRQGRYGNHKVISVVECD